MAFLPLGTLHAQDPGTGSEVDLEGTLVEGGLEQDDIESLLLDNTRSKIGRDFYEVFFRTYNESAAASRPLLPDSVARQSGRAAEGFELNLFLITIDELPANSGMGSFISILVNDELLFQQFVQGRADVIEELGIAAAQGIRQYIVSFAETQGQMTSEDQQGTGIF